MSETPYKDMEFNELRTQVTGEAIMMLGSGDSLKSIIHYAMSTALMWKQERDKAQKEKDEQEKKLREWPDLDVRRFFGAPSK